MHSTVCTGNLNTVLESLHPHFHIILYTVVVKLYEITCRSHHVAAEKTWLSTQNVLPLKRLYRFCEGLMVHSIIKQNKKQKNNENKRRRTLNKSNRHSAQQVMSVLSMCAGETWVCSKGDVFGCSTSSKSSAAGGTPWRKSHANKNTARGAHLRTERLAVQNLSPPTWAWQKLSLWLTQLRRANVRVLGLRIWTKLHSWCSLMTESEYNDLDRFK